MATFYSDEIKSCLKYFLSLKAGDFPLAKRGDEFWQLLENIGEICANQISARASAVDKKGVFLEDGGVVLSDETRRNIKDLTNLGYTGALLPEKYGGRGLPELINVAAIEMISQADSSLTTLVGLQDIAKIIDDFGSEEQKKRVLPEICKGRFSCAMALTEACAGSDLQSVATKAFEEDGVWYLDGVKHFVTNGGAEIILVLARSEGGVRDGRGLSLFLYERGRDDNCAIEKVEEKQGITGSPTCVLRFKKAKCELIGRRRFGLVKYLLPLLSRARVVVAAQALGIAQAAYDEARKYASSRAQFGKKIVEFPQIYQMVAQMEAKIKAARLLLYFTADEIDVLEKFSLSKLEDPSSQKREREKIELLSSIVKFIIPETANEIVYFALQIHGGYGYLKNVKVERLSRDVRVTTIYEGTTQIQVETIKNRLLKGFYADFMENEILPNVKNSLIKNKIYKINNKISNIVNKIIEKGESNFSNCNFVFLVEIAAILLEIALFSSFAEKEKKNWPLFRRFASFSFNRIGVLFKDFGQSQRFK